MDWGSTSWCPEGIGRRLSIASCDMSSSGVGSIEDWDDSLSLAPSIGPDHTVSAVEAWEAEACSSADCGGS